MHPHFIVPRSLLRTPTALCITADYANGGNLFTMVRRSGCSGLPPAAAVYIFQQVATTTQFGQRHGIWLHQLPPSVMLVHWNTAALPIVRVNTFRYLLEAGDPDEVRPTTPRAQVS